MAAMGMYICNGFVNEWDMYVKVVLLILYIAILAWVVLKWRKCSFSVVGNEIIFMLLPMPAVMLLPGGVHVCAMRVAAVSLIFGFYVFWSRLLYKDTKYILPFAAVMSGVVLLFEAVVLVLPKVLVESLLKWYLVPFYIVSALFVLPLVVKWNEERAMKNTLNVCKVSKALLYALVFLLTGCASAILLLLFPHNDVLASVVLAVLGIMPLLYFLAGKPACTSHNEMWEIKKRAYILGRGIKDGELLGEEHGLASENLVDDVKIIYNLINLFEKEKLYRNLDLKINDVARMIGTNKTYLSRALNTRLSRNFCQFVNYYRIREVCSLYIKNPKVGMKIISEQCGFSSQSNFSIVFKYNTGCTPGDWCRIVKAKLERDEPVQIDDYFL